MSNVASTMLHKTATLSKQQATKLAVASTLLLVWTGFNEWSNNFDERSHRRKGANFSLGAIQCGTDKSETLHPAAAVALSCRYWGLNDPFAAYTAAKIPNDFQWFSTLKIAISLWGSRPPSNTWFLVPLWVSPQTASRSIQPFCTAHPCAQHTDTQTGRHADHATCDICRNKPHLWYGCHAAY